MGADPNAPPCCRPWFQCEDCGDSIKKPKLAQHCNGGCSASRFTCIDCSRTFDRHSVQAHNSCVTEHDKYAKGATKPGGFAEKGFFDAAAPAAQPAPGESAFLFVGVGRRDWEIGEGQAWLSESAD